MEKPPIVKVTIEHCPATGETDIRFDAGGQLFVANLLLDCVGQIVNSLILRDEKMNLETTRAIVLFQLNTANQLIAKTMKPGLATINRIEKPISLVGG